MEGSGASAAPAESPAAPELVLPAANQTSPPVIAPLDTSVPVPPERRLERQYSVRSTEVVGTLAQIELEVSAMETQLSEADVILAACKPGEEPDPQLRNDLAQLHGNANKLLATRIDAILTSELISGRDDARAKRKALIKVVEKLIDNAERHVKKYDALKKASPQAKGPTVQ